MSARGTACSLLTASIAILVLPAQASAEYLVPPGNSAATQYTEAVPTAGGHRDTEKESQQKGRSPSQVLGAHKARQLEAQGEAGREAAEFAAETAPSAAPAPQSRTGEDKTGRQRNTAKKRRDGERQTSGAATRGPRGGGPSGSGGLGQVVDQATGNSSGELGLWLPLAIVATAGWALAFLLRTRRRSTS